MSQKDTMSNNTQITPEEFNQSVGESVEDTHVVDGAHINKIFESTFRDIVSMPEGIVTALGEFISAFLNPNVVTDKDRAQTEEVMAQFAAALNPVLADIAQKSAVSVGAILVAAASIAMQIINGATTPKDETAETASEPVA